MVVGYKEHPIIHNGGDADNVFPFALLMKHELLAPIVFRSIHLVVTEHLTDMVGREKDIRMTNILFELTEVVVKIQHS